MTGQQYQEEFTGFILDEVRKGERTTDDVTQTTTFLEEQEATNLDLYKGSREALTILQSQQP